MYGQPIEQLTPLTLKDLDTALRVLRTIDEFQKHMHDSGGFRPRNYADAYSSAITPAIAGVKTFRDSWAKLNNENHQ